MLTNKNKRRRIWCSSEIQITVQLFENTKQWTYSSPSPISVSVQLLSDDLLLDLCDQIIYGTLAITR
ncbi:hypothetical protein L6452_04251 [Arctium lappa]|uniref:Uncharacterized protein n=1 Tax=Arctium lappa TaxID=4217 RepID=A0ACB9FQ42_ARCLA|nr:hypothetical protein L6452_04251 [Arctium lappa]